MRDDDDVARTCYYLLLVANQDLWVRMTIMFSVVSSSTSITWVISPAPVPILWLDRKDTLIPRRTFGNPPSRQRRKQQPYFKSELDLTLPVAVWPPTQPQS